MPLTCAQTRHARKWYSNNSVIHSWNNTEESQKWSDAGNPQTESKSRATQPGLCVCVWVSLCWVWLKQQQNPPSSFTAVVIFLETTAGCLLHWFTTVQQRTQKHSVWPRFPRLVTPSLLTFWNSLSSPRRSWRRCQWRTVEFVCRYFFFLSSATVLSMNSMPCPDSHTYNSV